MESMRRRYWETVGNMGLDDKEGYEGLESESEVNQVQVNEMGRVMECFAEGSRFSVNRSLKLVKVTCLQSEQFQEI